MSVFHKLFLSFNLFLFFSMSGFALDCRNVILSFVQIESEQKVRALKILDSDLNEVATIFVYLRKVLKNVGPPLLEKNVQTKKGKVTLSANKLQSENHYGISFELGESYSERKGTITFSANIDQDGSITEVQSYGLDQGVYRISLLELSQEERDLLPENISAASVRKKGTKIPDSDDGPIVFKVVLDQDKTEDPPSAD